MAKKRATLTDLLNDLTFRILYDKFRMLSCSAFEWDGLPEGIEEKYIERYLFDHGKAIFFKDPAMSFMCLEAQTSGQLNVYGEPLKWFASGFNYHKSFNADDCIIIDNNPLRIATHDFVMFYVNKLTESERTMDVNVKAVKTPYIIACDDKDVLTFKRIFQMIDGNTPCIYADKGLNLDALNVLKTDAKFLCNELMDYKKSVENELLTLLGFDNLAVDKKERVNLSEANSNNQMTRSFAELQLESRQLACDRINEKWGLELSVKRREVETDVVVNDAQHNETDNGTARYRG